MVLKKWGFISATLGFALAAIDHSYTYVVPRITDGRWNILSQTDSPTVTLLVYQNISNAASFILGFIAVFIVGYAAGKQLSFADDYGSFVAAISGSAVLGYLVQIVLLAVLTGVSITGDYMTLDLIATFGSVVTVPIQFGIAGFAGGAYAHFTAR